ncbi:Cln5-like protein 1 [Bulinus truncatus]|nr:Cln5-like protein 1 [Bulinus truncatus]
MTLQACKKEGNDYTDMGKQSNYDWSYTGYYPLVTYSTGGGKKTEVMLICDATKPTPQLDVVGEVVPGTLSMNLWSLCACPNKCPRVDPSQPDSGSLSDGYIVLIVFFSLLFVYLVGGILINFARTRSFSKETLPNFNFWSSIPGLVADGCCCLFTSVKSKGKKEYDAI